MVDDDPTWRFLIQVVLGEAGDYEITEANHGQAALDAIAISPPPDIIVTDLMMPVMTGMELVRRLRQDRVAPAVRILVVSGNVDSTEGDEILELVDGMLSKDFLVDDLLETVKRIGQRRQARASG